MRCPCAWRVRDRKNRLGKTRVPVLKCAIERNVEIFCRSQTSMHCSNGSRCLRENLRFFGRRHCAVAAVQTVEYTRIKFAEIRSIGTRRRIMPMLTLARTAADQEEV